MPVTCPACGYVGMEEKQTKTMGASRKCLKCGHEDDRRGGRAGGAGRDLTASVVGGGLAGSEAAWALAERGVAVTLHEMRPVRARRPTRPIASPSWSAATRSNRSSSPTPTASSRPRCVGWGAWCSRWRTWRACRAARPSRWTGRSSPRPCTTGSPRHPNITRGARGGHGAAVARGRRHRPAHVRAGWVARSRSDSARPRSPSSTPSRPSSRTIRSTTMSCSGPPATARAAATTT